MSIIPTIPFCTNDAQNAEAICSWIYRLNGKKPLPHALLICDTTVHDEVVLKMTISAMVAFQSVEVHQIPKVEGSKNNKVNYTLLQAARYIASNYRFPWLWLEPDCVPLQSDWLERLTLAYNSQPKRYMAAHQDWGTKDKPRLCIARQAIYPADAAKDLEPLCKTNDLAERYGGIGMVHRSTKTRLIQQVSDWEASTEVRKDAVLLHRDKSGMLIRKIRAEQESVMA